MIEGRYYSLSQSGELTFQNTYLTFAEKRATLSRYKTKICKENFVKIYSNRIYFFGPIMKLPKILLATIAATNGQGELEREKLNIKLLSKVTF